MSTEGVHANKDDAQNTILSKTDWMNSLIVSMGGYLHPVIVNGKEIYNFNKSYDFDEPVYVYVDFVKPGKHVYTVDFERINYLHKTIVRCREEEIIVFNKKMNFRKKEFDFGDSVFSDYHKDDDSCYIRDLEFWRINGFIKKEAEKEELSRYLAANYNYIQDLYV